MSQRKSDWERHQEYLADYAKMLAAATPAQLAELKSLGLDEPVAWDKGSGSRTDDVLSKNRRHGLFGDPADEAVDLLVGETVEADDLAKIADVFTSVLVWAAEARSPVEMGWRWAAMMRVMRPALLEGMRLEVKRELEKGLHVALAGADPVVIGEHFQVELEWCRRCTKLSRLGMRGFAVLYVLRRDLLNDLNTNAAIAALQNKTRQAFNKLVQGYRDARDGFRNAVMRGQTTRERCRNAQLHRAPRTSVNLTRKQHPVQHGDRNFAKA